MRVMCVSTCSCKPNRKNMSREHGFGRNTRQNSVFFSHQPRCGAEGTSDVMNTWYLLQRCSNKFIVILQMCLVGCLPWTHISELVWSVCHACTSIVIALTVETQRHSSIVHGTFELHMLRKMFSEVKNINQILPYCEEYSTFHGVDSASSESWINSDTGDNASEERSKED